MDISSLPESQQQQLLQLHQKFQEHQQQSQIQHPPLPYQDYAAAQSSYYYQHYYQPNPQFPPNPYNHYPNPIPNPHPNFPVPQAINPAAAAAVAALSQLTQFAGTMDAAERAISGIHTGGDYAPLHHPPIHHSDGQSSYRGRGRRGGNGPSRGGGRDNSIRRSSFRGRGRGRGRGEYYLPSGAPLLAAGESMEPTHAVQDPSQALTEEVVQNPASVPTNPMLQALWCELCRVDCTSAEILVQHKSGKKHKRNMEKLECQNNPQTVQARGTKRKTRGGGRGGKQARAAEPPKPKMVIPLICDLCNAKCDTQEVFNCHLAGKKHVTKLKKFEDHGARYGPLGLQALYPPNPMAQTLLPQGHPPQSLYQAPQQFPFPYVPPQNDQPLQFNQNSNVVSNVRSQHDPDAQSSKPTLVAAENHLSESNGPVDSEAPVAENVVA